jgi:hypothetical protein
MNEHHSDMTFILFFALSVLLVAQQAPPPVNSNSDFSHTLQTTHPSRIWHFWTHPSTWKSWDGGLKDATTPLEPLELAATGTIKPLSGPSARFKVTALTPGKSITFDTRLPLATLSITRTLDQSGPTATFTHRVRFRGFLGWFWAARFGPGFRRELPLTMQRLADLARQ